MKVSLFYFLKKIIPCSFCEENKNRHTAMCSQNKTLNIPIENLTLKYFSVTFQTFLTISIFSIFSPYI